jgi:hypothetical protein
MPEPAKKTQMYPKVNCVTEAEKRALFFTTTNDEALAWKPRVKTENFQDVHFMGQRNHPDMPFKVNTAPFFQRSSTAYGQQFKKPHHNDAKVCAELYRNNKEKAEKSMDGSPADPFDRTQSSYRQEYIIHMGMPSESCGESQGITKTIPRDSDNMLYLNSVQHHQFHDKGRVYNGIRGAPKAEMGDVTDFPKKFDEVSHYESNYSEDPVRAGMRNPLTRGPENDSTRVIGSAVPAKVLRYKSEHKIARVKDLPPVLDMLYKSKSGML